MSFVRWLVTALMFFITLKSSLAAITNYTTYDDGLANFSYVLNQTESDYTRIRTLPVNSAIFNASQNITPGKYLYYLDATDTTGIVGGLEDVTLVPGTNILYATNGTNAIYKLYTNGSLISVQNYNWQCDNNGTNIFTDEYNMQDLYGVKAVNEDILYVMDDTINETKSVSGSSQVVKINYTKGTTDGCMDKYNFNVVYPGIAEPLDTPRGLTLSDDQYLIWITDYLATTGSLWQLDVRNCTSSNTCWSSTNFTLTQKKSSLAYPRYLDTEDNGTTLLMTVQTRGLYIVDVNNNYDLKRFVDSFLDGSGAQLFIKGIGVNGSVMYNSNSLNNKQVLRYRWDYPQGFSITSGIYTLYENTGLFNESARIFLNQTGIENYAVSNGTVPFTYNIGKGYVIVDDILFTSNSSNNAVLNIISPVEISYNTEGTSNYTINITIENLGRWDANNCSMRTVSTGTPNLNDQLSYSVFSVLQNSNSSIELTILNIGQSAEPDERLNIFCTNATENNETMYSNYIDVDITYTPVTSTPPGSSGGINQGESKALFDIVGVNAYNQDTAQLSIRPANTREYCLEIVNYADVTQDIYIECDLPSSQSKNLCSWIEFDRQRITVQPSEELREKFCMTITTPFDIAIGEKYVVNIKGTVMSPSSQKGSTDVHSITMFVTDPSLVFSNILDQAQSTSIIDSFYASLKKYIKADISELPIQNWYNPILIVMHILFFILLKSVTKKPSLVLKIIVQVLALIFSVLAMYSPFILVWIYIILVFVLFWSVVVERLLNINLKKAFQ